jgi:hypothetical protein
MGIGKIVLIGGAVIGVGYLFLKHSEAHAASAPASGPPTPGPGAASMSVPPGPKNPTGLTLTITQWQQQAGPGGQQAGLWGLVQNAANPQVDYVVTFGTGTGAGVVQKGSSQNSGLIAQSFVAGLLA